MRKRLLASLSALALLTVVGTSGVAASHVSSELIAGNPTCNGTKIDPVNAGTYNLVGGGTITITLGAGNTFTFTVDGADVTSIVVKGGPNALLYTNPGEGSILHAQVNPNNGKYYGLSHLCINSEKDGGGGKK
ncbi:MAG: hypothetical protein H0T59_00655 [Chloroflexi bacterium]|nr:hypothetical protein [Chloroflexota bacterium]